MRLRQHIFVLSFYLAVAIVITYPLITVFSTQMIGHPISDAYEYTHHVWWIKTALQTGQNPFFMPDIVYPDGANAVLLWSIPLQSFPAWLFDFVLSLPAAFNLAALLTLALNGWAMFSLARYLISLAVRLPAKSFAPITPAIPALIAGLVFMIYPAFQGQLGAAHVGLLTLYPAPLFLYMLLRLRDVTHARWWILGGALLFMVSLWGSVLLLIYLIAPITILYFALLVAARDGQAFRRGLVTVALGVVFALPFVVPLAINTLQAPPEAGSVRYSASLLGIVSPSFYHPLFGSLGYNREVLGLDPFEWTSYIGVIAAALSLIAVWKVRAARAWLIVALVAWVLSLGPLLKIVDAPVTFRIDGYSSTITLPEALLEQIPLITIARTPARYNFAVGFAVAVMVGYGVMVIASRLRDRHSRWLAAIILIVAITFEYQVWWGLPTINGVVPAPIAALSERNDVRAVLDLPVNSLANKDAMFLQTGHQHPLITGQVARRSPVNPAKVGVLQSTLDPAILDAEQVDVIIVHKAYDPDGALQDRVQTRFGDPFYEDADYAAFNVPLVEYLPQFAAVPSTDTTITDPADSYVYAPFPGWVDVTATLTSDTTLKSDGRQVVALLDGTPIRRWTIDGASTVRFPVPISAGAFETISLALDPACPAHFDPALTCDSVELSDLKLDFTPAIASTPIPFDKGVTLANASLPTTATAGETISVRLLWQFDQSRSSNDIRFVHVTDATGELIAQDDTSLDAIEASEMRAESVAITLPDDLPEGDYTVSAGWYHYPDVTNFCVLTDGACSGNDATLGTVTVTN